MASGSAAAILSADALAIGLVDPASLAIVAGGTVLASAARCGLPGLAAAGGEAVALLRRGLDIEGNRRALARAVSEVERDGARRANPSLPPDRTLALMLETLLRGSAPERLDGLRQASEEALASRRDEAIRVFATAGELAPVFGLVGTLLGLAQLGPMGAAQALPIAATISGAVLTTLYGVLIAHFVCFPLAAAIARRAEAETAARSALAAWFVQQLASTTNHERAPRPHLRGLP
jgi:chemotaxis protein MotA